MATELSGYGSDLEYLKGEFTAEGLEVYVEMEIPASVIRSVDYAPKDYTPTESHSIGIPTAIRIEVKNGNVFWSRGDRSWYKQPLSPTAKEILEEIRIKAFPKVNEDAFFTPNYSQFAHVIDPYTRVCTRCKRDERDIKFNGGRCVR